MKVSKQLSEYIYIHANLINKKISIKNALLMIDIKDR